LRDLVRTFAIIIGEEPGAATTVTLRGENGVTIGNGVKIGTFAFKKCEVHTNIPRCF